MSARRDRSGKHLACRCSLLCLIVLCLPLSAFGSPTDKELLDKALTSFKQGHAAIQDAPTARADFTRAAELFEQLENRGVCNAAHYLNQGNAELLAGKLGPAILSYRRGLQFASRHAALSDNLQYARTLVSQPRASELTRPPADNGLPMLSSTTIFIATFVCWSLACVSIAARLIAPRFVWIGSALASATLALLFAALVGWRMWERHIEETTPLVVIARNKTPFYQGNGVSYPLHADVPELSEGMEARRLYKRGGWLQIQFASGLSGWIRADAALMNLRPDQKGPD